MFKGLSYGEVPFFAGFGRKGGAAVAEIGDVCADPVHGGGLPVQ